MGLPIEDIEVSDAILAEEGPGHGAMKPNASFSSLISCLKKWKTKTYFHISPSRGCQVSLFNI